MEPSRGNRGQPVANRPTAKTPETSPGKEGVDGSSPSEGSAKVQHVAAFCVQPDLQGQQRAVGMEPFMLSTKINWARRDEIGQRLTETFCPGAGAAPVAASAAVEFTSSRFR